MFDYYKFNHKHKMNKPKKVQKMMDPVPKRVLDVIAPVDDEEVRSFNASYGQLIYEVTHNKAKEVNFI